MFYYMTKTEAPKDSSHIKFTLVPHGGLGPALTLVHLLSSRWVVNVD